MDKIQALKQEIKKLNAKKYRRFNVLLKKEAFIKLEKISKNKNESKAKTLSNLIIKYQQND